MTVKELLEKRVKLISDARGIYTAAESAKREVTAEERTRFDDLMKTAESMKDDVDRLSGLEVVEKGLTESRGRKTQTVLANEKHEARVRWMDAEGHEVRCLSTGEKINDALTPEERRAGNPNGERLSLGKMLRGLITGRWADAEAEQRAQMYGGGTSGGFLVQGEMYAQTLDLMRNYSACLLAGVQTVLMSTHDLIIARITQDPTAFWTQESNAITESSSAFGRLELHSNKLAILMRISNELLADAPNAAAILEGQIARTMGLGIDSAILSGTGAAGQPAGILAGEWSINTSAIGGAPDLDDLLNGLNLIEVDNHKANAIMWHPATANYVRKLKDGEGRYMPLPADIQALLRFSTNQMSSGTILLGDFSKAILGLRAPGADSGIEVAFGEQAENAFTRDETLIRCTWRGDVGLAYDNAFCSLTGITY